MNQKILLFYISTSHYKNFTKYYSNKEAHLMVLELAGEVPSLSSFKKSTLRKKHFYTATRGQQFVQVRRDLQPIGNILAYGGNTAWILGQKRGHFLPKTRHKDSILN